MNQLVRQAPVASELRFLIAVLRIVPEVELSAALAGEIGRRGNMHIGTELPARVRGLVAQLFTRVQEMWRRVADAYRDRSPEVYASLEADDEEIDELHTGLMRNSLPTVLRAPVGRDGARRPLLRTARRSRGRGMSLDRVVHRHPALTRGRSFGARRCCVTRSVAPPASRPSRG